MGKLLHKGIDYTGVSPYEFVPITEADYNALTPAEQEDETKMYWLYDVDTVSADIDDESVSSGKVWSSEKVSSEISDVQDQVDTNTDDISTLNSALTDLNCKIGAEIVASVTWNSVGWTPLSNVDNIVTPPVLSGYTCIGFIFKQTSTYRIIAPYAYYSSGSWNIAFYAANTSSTSGTVSLYPIYRKN